MAIFRWQPDNGGVECKVGLKKITIFDQCLAISRKLCSYYGRWIRDRTQAFEWYQFELPWV